QPPAAERRKRAFKRSTRVSEGLHLAAADAIAAGTPEHRIGSSRSTATPGARSARILPLKGFRRWLVEVHNPDVRSLATGCNDDSVLVHRGLRARASTNESRPSAWPRIELIRHSRAFSPLTTCSPKGGSPSVSSCFKTGASAATMLAVVS